MSTMLVKNKKGDVGAGDLPGRKTPYWITICITFIILVFIFGFIVAQYKYAVVVISPELEKELSLYRFISSPNCFAYVDSSGDSHIGIIDWNKFTPENYDRCFSNEDVKKRQYRLILENTDTNEKKTIEDNSLAARQRIPKNVLIFNNKLYKGKLYLEVL